MARLEDKVPESLAARWIQAAQISSGNGLKTSKEIPDLVGFGLLGLGHSATGLKLAESLLLPTCPGWWQGSLMTAK